MPKRKIPIRFTGQHFTTDDRLIDKAVSLANIMHQDLVVDIGAGKGAISSRLIDSGAKVFAIENDPKLFTYLCKLFCGNPNIEISGADIRHIHLPFSRFKTVSNIPYNITAEILAILLFKYCEVFEGGSIIMQKEAARKLIEKDCYSPHVALYRTFFAFEISQIVTPESFYPQPNVESALVSCIPNKDVVKTIDKHKYLAFLTCMLTQPNATMSATLKRLFQKKQIRSALTRLPLDPSAKASMAPPYLWLALFNEMLEAVPDKHHPRAYNT